MGFNRLDVRKRQHKKVLRLSLLMRNSTSYLFRKHNAEESLESGVAYSITNAVLSSNVHTYNVLIQCSHTYLVPREHFTCHLRLMTHDGSKADVEPSSANNWYGVFNVIYISSLHNQPAIPTRLGCLLITQEHMVRRLGVPFRILGTGRGG
jgi:hypothetical protein